MPAKTINAIIKCNECRKLLVWQTSMLGIRYSGTLWTDLKYESMNDEEPFIKCPHCKVVMEPQKANIVSMKAFLDFNLTKDEVPCEFPIFEDYLSILENDSLNKELEKKIRIAMVHAYNDKRRYEDKGLGLSAEAKENIINLLPMCEEPLFIAELHRELGNFEEASSAMKFIVKKDTPIYELIDKLIAEKATNIVGVKY